MAPSHLDDTLLFESAPLYKLGAKLVHDMSTPIATLRICSHMLNQYCLPFLKENRSVLLKHIALNAVIKNHALAEGAVTEKAIDHLCALPAYHAELAQRLQACINNFWRELTQSKATASTKILKECINTLRQHWQDLDRYNQQALVQTLPACIECYRQQYEHPDMPMDKITRATQACIDLYPSVCGILSKLE